MVESAGSTSVSGVLARFVAETSWESLPPAVQGEAKRALLNFLGGCISVAREAPIEAVVALAGEYSGPRRVSLVGRPERLDVLWASFINAVAGNFLDFDDTHLATVIHPTAPVAPVALALCERDGLSGRDLLLATALGIEVACRVGLAVSPGHYDRGWHITASAGVFGAAAAAGKLMGLSPAVLADALGVAASEASGLVENLPTAAKNVGVGGAARNGLFAAQMAQAGYAAAPMSIEGPLGWARAMGDPFDLDAATGGLGTRWEILRNTYKPYPAGVVMHAVIDAALALRARGLKADDIESVVVSGDKLMLARGDRVVRNDRDSRVSIHHSVAIGVLLGKAGMAEFSADVVNDPAVVALRGKVKAQLADLPRGAAHVEVRLKSGGTMNETVTHALGSEERPLSDADIEAKVRALAKGTSSEGVIGDLIALVWRLDEVENVAPHMGVLTGQGRGRA